ncbi:MAG: class I SAM-dependent RNA methyltransferase [Chitinispirillaceae bacterium]
MEKTNIVITVPKGLCRFLQNEVEALGLPVKNTSPTSLQTEGTRTDAMRLNLHIRTGHHVLLEAARFRARNADELYSKISKIPWETMIPSNEYLSVVSNVQNPTIRDSRFANLRCKDAIVDRISARKGRRPDSGPERTGAVVNLFWREDRCVVYLDTSGETLSKRGYRKIPLGAPMQETLAAGVVMASGFKNGETFVNPMCGSGTLVIEAALAASERVPGLTRQNFGFFHLLGFDMKLWDTLKREARSRVVKNTSSQFIASDINGKAVDAARRNAETAGVSQMIRFEVCDYAETTVPSDPGVVMVNPEYGMRLGKESELIDTYRGMGSFFKHKCQGYRGYVFTANMKLSGKVGLKSRKKIPFNSGKVECRLYEYDLY